MLLYLSSSLPPTQNIENQTNDFLRKLICHNNKAKKPSKTCHNNEKKKKEKRI